MRSPGIASDFLWRYCYEHFFRIRGRILSSIDTSVVMPNHVHFICRIAEDRATARVAPTLGRIVGAYKSIVANDCRKAGLTGRLWQRGYYEHVIRGDADYRDIYLYIEGNPSKWAEDRYYQSLPEETDP